MGVTSSVGRSPRRFSASEVSASRTCSGPVALADSGREATAICHPAGTCASRHVDGPFTFRLCTSERVHLTELSDFRRATRCKVEEADQRASESIGVWMAKLGVAPR